MFQIFGQWYKWEIFTRILYRWISIHFYIKFQTGEIKNVLIMFKQSSRITSSLYKCPRYLRIWQRMHFHRSGGWNKEKKERKRKNCGESSVRIVGGEERRKKWVSLLEPLGSEGSGILKTGYGGKRRVPADVSHEFGSCARLNGTCPEHVRSTLFYGGICVYGSWTGGSSHRRQIVYERLWKYIRDSLSLSFSSRASFLSAPPSLSFNITVYAPARTPYITLSIYHTYCRVSSSETLMKSAPPTALAFHRFLFSSPLHPFPLSTPIAVVSPNTMQPPLDCIRTLV